MLSHVDSKGNMKMVDVGSKPVTCRSATARCSVRMQSETVALAVQGQAKKGDVLAAARIAGIMAAKRTSDIVPLCHGLNLTSVNLRFMPGNGVIDIEASVSCIGQTGVEMEALTAVSVAGLTIYDMCKAVDRSMVIDNIRLVLKSGGRSGDYQRYGEDAWEDK